MKRKFNTLSQKTYAEFNPHKHVIWNAKNTLKKLFQKQIGYTFAVRVLVKNLPHCANAEFSNFPLRLPRKRAIVDLMKKLK